MASSIINVKHQDYSEHTSCFEWKLNENQCSSWISKSPNIILHDERLCMLEVECSICQNFTNNFKRYKVTMSLKFVEDFSSKATEKVTVCMYIKNINYRDGDSVFKLKRINSKEYRSDNYFVTPNDFLSRSFEAFFEINLKEYASPLLIKDFTALLNSEQYSDFIIDVRDKTFKVHKNIISRRNGVLARMIETDMTEKKINKTTLNEWRPEVVETFLMFVYTGTCKIDDNYVELFQLAHFLQQSDLQKLVEKHMKHSINLDNFVLLFEMSGLYELKDLYNAVEIFFHANKDACVKNPAFEPCLRKSIKLSNIKFVLEIADAYNMNETLREAMEFVKNNYKDIAKDPKNRTFIQSNYNLLFKIFEHSLGYSPDEQK